MGDIIPYETVRRRSEDYSPLVSIIIPTYNRPNETKRAIESVYSQDYTNYEVIVIDDGSSDETVNVVKKVADYRVSIYRNIKNSGVSVSRNLGIKLAEGDFLCFLDSDDEWLPGKLTNQLNHIADLPNTVGLIYGAAENIKNGEKSIFYPRYRGVIFNDMLGRNCLHGACSNALIKKEVFDRVGGFDPLYPAIEDYEMWLRVCKVFSVDFTSKILHKYYDLRDEQAANDRISQRHFDNIFARLMLFDKWKGHMKDINLDNFFVFETAKLAVKCDGLAVSQRARLLCCCIRRLPLDSRLYGLLLLGISPVPFRTVHFLRQRILRFISRKT